MHLAYIQRLWVRLLPVVLKDILSLLKLDIAGQSNQSKNKWCTFVGDRTPIQNGLDGKEEVYLVCMQIWSNGYDSSLPNWKCGFDSRYLLFADITQR